MSGKKGPKLDFGNINRNNNPDHVDPLDPSRPPRDLDSSANLRVNNQEFDCDANDLDFICELGRGNFGVVNRVKHRPSGVIMAVKRIRANVSAKDQKYIFRDLDVSMKSNSPYTVKVYGALFKEGDVWICMEAMTESFDKFYSKVYQQGRKFSEYILCYIADCVIRALSYLHFELKVIHRDVKPSNILLDLQGYVKLCDFGISGQLENSIAKTQDAGCRPYMAPERINPIKSSSGGYDIRSDVWSFGITMMEISTGTFPYAKWGTPFEQLKQVVVDEPPRLPNDGTFSTEYQEFISICLQKDETRRLKYDGLLQHPFLQKKSITNEDAANFFKSVLEQHAAASSS